MSYTNIINSFIKKREYTNYLEIGVFDSVHFNKVNCENKTAVDPNPKVPKEEIEGNLEKVTSDEFFENYKSRKKFDCIFIDGLHTAEQAKKDIENSLKYLKKGGVIFMHDIEPPTKWHARPLSEYSYPEEWCGDVWKAFWESYDETEFHFATFAIIYGLGVIDTSKKGSRKVKSPKTYEEMLDKNAKIRTKPSE